MAETSVFAFSPTTEIMSKWLEEQENDWDKFCTFSPTTEIMLKWLKEWENGWN